MNQQKVQMCLAQFPSFRVGVIGDIMLDRYIFGSATKLSPEAPVPVVRVQKSKHTLGGAANVARNIAHLGGQVTIFSIIGNDQDGNLLMNELLENHINTSMLEHIPNRRTTVKTRIIAGHQQIVRIDEEIDDPIPEEVANSLIHKLQRALDRKQLDAVIIEDYHKGICTPFIQHLLQELVDHYTDVAWFLDPHPASWFMIKRLTALTPNRNEAFHLVQIQDTTMTRKFISLDDIAQKILDIWDPKFLLITLGEDGMCLYPKEEKKKFHIPTVAKEVFDVSGAGDTVIATLSLGYLCHLPMTEACILANHAAGIVVGKLGTATVTPNELLQSFS